MAITIQQIAEKAGVSRGTVDRALNHRGRIDPQVEDMILKIADEMGYVPRARKARNRKVCRIGVITQLAKYSFMTEVNQGIQDAAKELRNQQVELLLEEGLSVDEKDQLDAINRLVLKGIDALAIMPVDHDLIRDRLNELCEQGIPVISFNTDIPGTGRVAFVGMDNVKSGQTAAGLMGMLTRGAGRILVITGFFGNRINSLRVEGFVNEIKESFPGLSIAGVQSCFDDAEEVEKIVMNAMLGAQEITGILVVSAGQSGLEASFSKLRMDRRPFVITYDLTPWSRRALAENQIDFLIDQDGYFQGYRAVWLLANMLQNEEAPQDEYEYTDISIRTKYNI